MFDSGLYHISKNVIYPSSSWLIQYYMHQTDIICRIWYIRWNAFISMPSIACYIEKDYDCNMSSSNMLVNSSSMVIAHIPNHLKLRNRLASFYLFELVE